MDNLCLCTSVYHLRKTRSIDYYLTPTIHLLQDLKNIDICLFTDQDKNIFPKGNNIHIFNIPPNDLIKEIWDNHNWKKRYKVIIENPELLAIWLGKFTMMKIASQYGNVLWQDSGIRLTKLFNKDFLSYKKVNLDESKYNQFTQNLLLNNSLNFVHCEKKNTVYHGVDMGKYGLKDKYQIRAGFILAKSDKIQLLYDGIKEKWAILVKNNDFGTEENALSLFVRDHNVGIFSYDMWLNGLGLCN